MESAGFLEALKRQSSADARRKRSKRYMCWLAVWTWLELQKYFGNTEINRCVISVKYEAKATLAYLSKKSGASGKKLAKTSYSYTFHNTNRLNRQDL